MEKHLTFQITDWQSLVTAVRPNAETNEDDVEERHLENVNPIDKKSELDGEEIGVEEIEAPSCRIL